MLETFHDKGGKKDKKGKKIRRHYMAMIASRKKEISTEGGREIKDRMEGVERGVMRGEE